MSIKDKICKQENDKS